jgi:hypothetical protein
VALSQVTVQAFRGSTLELRASTPSLALERTGPRAGSVSGGPVSLELVARGVRLSADRVEGDAFRGALTATAVRASTPTGVQLSSPRASYQRDMGPEGTAFTDAGVLVRHPRFELEAASGRLDLATDQAELDQVVTRSRTPATR